MPATETTPTLTGVMWSNVPSSYEYEWVNHWSVSTIHLAVADMPEDWRDHWEYGGKMLCGRKPPEGYEAEDRDAEYVACKRCKAIAMKRGWL